MIADHIRTLARFALIGSVFTLSVNTSPAADNEKPNILLIYADDIGYEALGCYGGLDFKTPRLDRMAKEGVRFARAYASPVCTPSRVSMHTGLYVTRHHHLGVLPVHRGTDKIVNFQKLPTFAQSFRHLGYATSVTGKWQLATLEFWPNHIRDAGFDSWCVWQIWNQGKKTLRHWNPTFNQDGSIRDDIADRFGPDVLVEYVIEQMRAASTSEQPFLIVHNELLPHDPIIDTPTDRRLGRPAKLDHMIEYMDALAGRLLDAVNEMGIRDSTYVVFMGDNGTHEEDFRNPNANSPREGPHTRHTEAGLVNGGKFKIGDAGTHVPLIVWGPQSVPMGSVCNDLVDVVDLFPTFCELASIDIPNDIDGLSIAPQIHGRSGRRRQWVLHGITKHKERPSGLSVFDGSWRLLQHGDQLWDARNLPLEKTNPSGEEASRAKTQLATILNDVLDSAAD